MKKLAIIILGIFVFSTTIQYAHAAKICNDDECTFEGFSSLPKVEAPSSMSPDGPLPSGHTHPPGISDPDDRKPNGEETSECKQGDNGLICGIDKGECTKMLDDITSATVSGKTENSLLKKYGQECGSRKEICEKLGDLISDSAGKGDPVSHQKSLSEKYSRICEKCPSRCKTENLCTIEEVTSKPKTVKGSTSSTPGDCGTPWVPPRTVVARQKDGTCKPVKAYKPIPGCMGKAKANKKDEDAIKKAGERARKKKPGTGGGSSGSGGSGGSSGSGGSGGSSGSGGSGGSSGSGGGGGLSGLTNALGGGGGMGGGGLSGLLDALKNLANGGGGSGSNGGGSNGGGNNGGSGSGGGDDDDDGMTKEELLQAIIDALRENQGLSSEDLENLISAILEVTQDIKGEDLTVDEMIRIITTIIESLLDEQDDDQDYGGCQDSSPCPDEQDDGSYRDTENSLVPTQQTPDMTVSTRPNAIYRTPSTSGKSSKRKITPYMFNSGKGGKSGNTRANIYNTR